MTVLWLAMLCCGTADTEAARVEQGMDVLSVDYSTVLNDTRRCPIGVNMDYLMDDDKNQLLTPRRTLVEALRELGPRYLRYPGGWKSAINLWSSPPYGSSRPTLAYPMPQEWLPKGVGVTNPEGTWTIDPLDFDEFMKVCRTLKAEPCLVVAYESCHWPAKGNRKPPSREQLLETAAAWVRYANKTKDYKVKFWEIGNETWLRQENWSNQISAATYAADLVEFSQRMKAEDAAIQIGANGDTDDWWREVLTRAAHHIDFLSVHSYPCWKWAGYDDYRTNELGILGIVKVATNAIARYAPEHRKRLKIALTEFAAGTFGDWDKTPADLGRALITFDLQGQLLQSPEVYFSQFWTTHNIYLEVEDVFSMLKRDNSLSPIGRAFRVWSQFLGDEIVAATSTANVRCFACRRADRELCLFLLNKDVSSRQVEVGLRSLPDGLREGEQWVLHGESPADRNPKWTRVGSVDVMNSRIAMRLQPVSLTVVRLTKDSSRKNHQP